MSEQLNISVTIAGRPYRLKVSPTEEQNVRLAANAINQRIAEFQNAYSAKDQQDYLAMVSLLFTAEKIQLEGNSTEISTVVLDALTTIDQEIHSIEQIASPAST